MEVPVMGKRLGHALGFAVLLAVVVVGSACNKNKNMDAVVQGNSEGGPPPGMGFGGPGGRRGPIGQTMAKLFKGRPSLKDSIGQELNSDAPSWDTIQPQTKEFAELAASVSKYDPPKGSKDSWTKLATAFSEQATALDHAAAAKNKNDALAAYSTISESCKTCHQAHRGGPGGGMGMPPGGFRGKGGPPNGPPPQPQ
jgi:cytochrome c556